MASRGRRILPGLEGTDPDRPPPPLTSDLHEEIFLRAASPADLARASAACVSFRRLISDPGFLRRYRSIHPPPLLGFLSFAGFQPAEAPHPSAAVARAVAHAADFSFDFIPLPSKQFHWYPCDVRDGRVLVKLRRRRNGDSCGLAVCDPLFRRYLMLPPVADDLLASVELQNEELYFAEAFFIPSGDMEETSFSVIHWAQSDTKLVVFSFSSGCGHWSVSACTSFDCLGLFGEGGVELDSCQCVYGCFYWKVNCANKLFKLDTNTMELSSYDLPVDYENEEIIGDSADIIIVESGERKVAMFSQVSTTLQYYNLLQNGTDKSHEWHMKSTIPFPAQHAVDFFMNGPAEGYIFLAGTPKEQYEVHSAFSLEIKSFKIERVCRITSRFYNAIPYFGFPPFMSSRRIP